MIRKAGRVASPMTMKTALATLATLAAAVVLLPACDASEQCIEAVCGIEDDDETFEREDAEPAPPVVAPTQTPEPEAHCDADSLEGEVCQCGALELEFRTFDGELVSAGEDPLQLAKSGNGIGVAFGFCGDTYVWEDGKATCAVIVARPDSGCMGVTLADIPATADRPAVECPYVDHTAACAPTGG